MCHRWRFPRPGKNCIFGSHSSAYMSVIHNKDIGTKQKALAINLDPSIYGSFAEIGAGQDVAANFFKAGASSGTIAKTMSAYDMTFSDVIYGTQKGGRYVSEARLIAMLEKEYGL